MVRNTRAACGLKLPPRYVSTIVVDPDEAERALYAAAMAAVRGAAEPRIRRTAGLLLLEAGSSPAAVRGTLDRQGGEPQFAELRGAAHVDETRKGRALVDIVRAGGAAQVLVFTRYRATAGWLGELLARERISHATVHGERTAAEKQAALAAFRSGDVQILVSTDVGSEGHCMSSARPARRMPPAGPGVRHADPHAGREPPREARSRQWCWSCQQTKPNEADVCRPVAGGDRSGSAVPVGAARFALVACGYGLAAGDDRVASHFQVCARAGRVPPRGGR
jgi:hypothetical protein